MAKTNYVDEDGWLTWMEATGGRKRARCHIDCHAYEARDAKDSEPSSAELLDEFLCTPEKLALVVSDYTYDRPAYYANSWRDSRIESALAVAITCDAAGLIPAGTKVICCTLVDHTTSVRLSHNQRWTSESDVGHTAHKAAELANNIISAGVHVVCAPDGWEPSDVRVKDWVAQEAKDVALDAHHSCAGLSIPRIPVLNRTTQEIKKVALMRSEDQANGQRKRAVGSLRAVFRNFDAPMPRLIEALSFGLIGADDVVPRPYKVPSWKRRLLEPSTQQEDSFPGAMSDELGVAISACARIWQMAFDKYLIEPVSVKKLHNAKELDYEEILEGWQQVGTALGIEDALAAVVHDGVAIEDVLSLI